jgi:hypothetical protein
MIDEADQQSVPPDGGAYWSTETKDLLRRQSHRKRAGPKPHASYPKIVGRVEA